MLTLKTWAKQNAKQPQSNIWIFRRKEDLKAANKRLTPNKTHED